MRVRFKVVDVFSTPKILCLAVVYALFVSASNAEQRPNILFIFSDDHAPTAIGAYGGWLQSVNPTPEIDRLAQSGMLFSNSFCTNSICGPSRAVIQTGKHSHKNGFTANGQRFDWNQQTFPKLLRAAGYQTALYGKSHLEATPQGFDDWKVLPGQGDYYNPDFITPEGTVRITGYCTDVVTDLAVEWLREQRDPARPFMLMVQHKAPHRNWMPALRHLQLYEDQIIPEPATLFDRWEDNASGARNQEMEIDRHMDLNYDLFLDMTPEFNPPAENQFRGRSTQSIVERMLPEQLEAWKRFYGPRNRAFHEAQLSGKDRVRWKYQRYLKDYLRCVRGVDESVGRLRKTLESLGLDENTVVIYSSDQGFFLGDHGWFDKRWMYEESLKMPLIVHWPGVTKPGSRNRDLVQNLDYAETFLEMAGVDIPGDMQGKSLVPLLKGEGEAAFRDAIYYHYYEFPGWHSVPKHNGIRTTRYKLMHFYELGEWEFYDIERDPDELLNLYDNPEYETVVRKMKEELRKLAAYYEDDSEGI